MLSGVIDGYARGARRANLFVALSGAASTPIIFWTRPSSQGAKALLVAKGQSPRASAAEGDYDVIRVKDVLTRARRPRARPSASMGRPGRCADRQQRQDDDQRDGGVDPGVSRSVLKTEGNLNNLIGVPMTLLGLEESSRGRRRRDGHESAR